MSQNTNIIKLGIVGTSGKNHYDKKVLAPKHMTWITNNVRQYIENVLHTTCDKIMLVSGGSAWTDHVAIQLYLTGEFAGLELFLVSKFDIKQKKYINTHEGRALNEMHKYCQEQTGIDVFNDMVKAIHGKNKAKVIIQRGFNARNTLLSKNCDHLMVFAFVRDMPENGGTYDTWIKIVHPNRINFDLADADNE